MKFYHTFIRFLAAGFGLGYAPVAPGTFGTLFGCALYYYYRAHSVAWMIRFSLILALISIVIAHLAEKSYGKKDCQKIVIDEIAGVMFCYMIVPYSVFHLVLGFLLFRLFDVAKIFPANWAQDHLPGGLGVVGDDLVAGLQGAILLFGLPFLVGWTNVLLQWFHRLAT